MTRSYNSQASGAIRLADAESSRLTGADVTGQLKLSGAQLTGADVDGCALVADWVKVGGRVILDRVRVTNGAIRLPGAEISGRLRCERARLAGADGKGRALLADFAKVAGVLSSRTRER